MYFSARLHDNQSFKARDTRLLVVSKVDHSSGIRRKDCSIANIVICLTATLLVVVCVVVGGVDSLVSSIQTDTKAATGWVNQRCE